ncbi:MAG: serine/threonine-protein kinase [Polyangiaceae bacterium]
MRIAAGGMATVYVGRLRGKHGFSRLVAIKRAHSYHVDDEQFRKGLIAEAKLASRIHHPNVVSVLDVDEPARELMLVMDYVEGGSLAQLLSAAEKAKRPLPPGVAVRIVLDACAGLHAAHQLADEHGAPLHIVHRDVSPQNILVGVDGHARIADFGIAKWVESTSATGASLRGKLAYMAPEYVSARTVNPGIDVFALGVVLWEALTNERLFKGETELDTLKNVIELEPRRVSDVDPSLPVALATVIDRALAKDPSRRFASMAELGAALEQAASDAGIDTTPRAVSELVRATLGEVLDSRRVVLREMLAGSTGLTTKSPVPESRESLVTLSQSAPGLTDARTVALPNWGGAEGTDESADRAANGRWTEPPGESGGRGAHGGRPSESTLSVNRPIPPEPESTRTQGAIITAVTPVSGMRPRRRAAFFLIAASVAGLLLTIGGVVLSRSGSRDQGGPASEPTLETSSPAALAPEAAPTSSAPAVASATAANAPTVALTTESSVAKAVATTAQVSPFHTTRSSTPRSAATPSAAPHDTAAPPTTATVTAATSSEAKPHRPGLGY